MKQLVLFVVFALLFTITKADDSKKYGKEIELKEAVKISKILETPDSFLGKKVLVEGTVVEVCEKRGCWIELASDKEYEKIRVKVNDGEIVFPMEAKGKTALVEGEVYLISKETEHKCNHKEGESCDAETHPKEVTKIYQIKGLGAQIK